MCKSISKQRFKLIKYYCTCKTVSNKDLIVFLVSKMTNLDITHQKKKKHKNLIRKLLEEFNRKFYCWRICIFDTFKKKCFVCVEFDSFYHLLLLFWHRLTIKNKIIIIIKRKWREKSREGRIRNVWIRWERGCKLGSQMRSCLKIFKNRKGWCHSLRIRGR